MLQSVTWNMLGGEALAHDLKVTGRYFSERKLRDFRGM